MAYLETMLELTKTASEGGILHGIGEGFQNFSALDPRDTPGSIGEYVRKVWPSQIAAQEARLGTLGITQKMGPAWRTLTGAVSKFKNPLLAAGILAAAAKTVASPVASAVSAADQAYHGHAQPVIHNVHYR